MSVRPPDEKEIAPRACPRCQRCVWVLGVAGGFRCTDPRNAVDGRSIPIPSQTHVCDHFTTGGASRRLNVVTERP